MEISIKDGNIAIVSTQNVSEEDARRRLSRLYIQKEEHEARLALIKDEINALESAGITKYSRETLKA